MDEYIMVSGGDAPRGNDCRYVTSVDKNGVHFSADIDDAIVLYDTEKCVFLARALTRVFCTVDVYSVKKETVRTFQYVW